MSCLYLHRAIHEGALPYYQVKDEMYEYVPRLSLAGASKFREDGAYLTAFLWVHEESLVLWTTVQAVSRMPPYQNWIGEPVDNQRGDVTSFQPPLSSCILPTASWYHPEYILVPMSIVRPRLPDLIPTKRDDSRCRGAG